MSDNDRYIFDLAISDAIRAKTGDDTTKVSIYLNKQQSVIAYSSAIEALIENRINVIKTLVAVNEQTAYLQLSHFITSYIASCPDYLDVLHRLSYIGNISPYTQPFLASSQSFFFDDNPIIDATEGIDTLLYQSYLFHRMIEELNDRVLIERQWPLLPLDMSQTNLIAHTLIGDEQANLLDQTVLIQLELINTDMADKTPEIFQHPKTQEATKYLKEDDWQKITQQWPLLNDDLSQCLYDI